MQSGSHTPANVRQRGAREALRDRLRGRRAKPVAGESAEIGDERDPMGAGESARRERTHGEVERGGQTRGPQRDASRRREAERLERQRQALQQRRHRARRVHALDQRERAAIGADQQMLAVVERDAGERDATRASAERSRLLDELDPHAGLRELDGGRASRPAAADDGDMAASASVTRRRDVFHAIQSLRSGVSAIRRSSTP